MSLFKSKQLDLVDLATALANIVNENGSLKSQWAGILNNTFNVAVYSVANNNITVGQSNFSVSYSNNPLEVFVYRNGIKLLLSVDFTVIFGTGSFTVRLNDPIGSSVGGSFNETIEINYY